VWLTIPHRKNKIVTKRFNDPRTWKESLGKRPKLRNVDLIFVTRNIRRSYRAGSVLSVSEELPKCKLCLLGTQEIRWERDGTKKNEKHELGIGFFCRIQLFQK
jgi:hypothetical protein